MNLGSVVDEDWQKYVSEQKVKELDAIIEAENLNSGMTYTFIENAFRDGGVQQSGTAFASVMPPVSRFSADNARGQKRETVLDKLIAFFNKYSDISNSSLTYFR